MTTAYRDGTKRGSAGDAGRPPVSGGAIAAGGDERLQGLDELTTPGGGHVREDPADRVPAPGDGIRHQRRARWGQTERHLSPALTGRTPADEPLVHQAVAEPRRRRGAHPYALGEGVDVERTVSVEEGQGPE